jgi:hypothetical protein
MKRLFFCLAVFILGVLTGAALTGVSIGNQVDALYIENRALQDNLQVAERELQQLRENSKTSHKRVISKITTRVAFSEACDYSEYERSTIELTVEKKVREWLKIISGQEVETINYQLVPRIVDNREMEVDGNKIQLKVNLVVIAENAVVFLEIVPLEDRV